MTDRRQTARILIASLVGTSVEFYDFYIYATAASLVFGPLFFPASSASAQLLASYASFGLAFLARPIGGDPAIVAGESGGVGLAALLRVADDAEARRLLDLGADAEVLLFNTEGATDPGIYRSITGIEPDALPMAARP